VRTEQCDGGGRREITKQENTWPGAARVRGLCSNYINNSRCWRSESAGVALGNTHGELRVGAVHSGTEDGAAAAATRACRTHVSGEGKLRELYVSRSGVQQNYHCGWRPAACRHGGRPWQGPRAASERSPVEVDTVVFRATKPYSIKTRRRSAWFLPTHLQSSSPTLPLFSSHFGFCQSRNHALQHCPHGRPGLAGSGFRCPRAQGGHPPGLRRGARSLSDRV
jgi:hypothetical protein